MNKAAHTITAANKFHTQDCTDKTHNKHLVMLTLHRG